MSKTARLRCRLSLLIACAVPLLMSLYACGDEESLAFVENGELVVTPDVLTFNAQGVGEPNLQYLSLYNAGRATVVVSRLELNSRSTEFAVGDVALPLRLAPGEERIIEVFYTPADCLIDRGSLLVVSNDRHRPERSVPLQPQDLGGQVLVTPSPIDFGRVPHGHLKTVPVTLTNTGTCALEVNDIFLTGSSDFEITQPAGDGVISFATELEAALPISLDPGARYTLDITFTPSNDGFDEATLIVRSDDARHRNVDTPVFANGAAPCIVVTDEDGIDFGARFIGEAHSKTVTITNCNPRQPLEIYGISLGADPVLGGADVFRLQGVPALVEPAVLDPGATLPFTLVFEPLRYTPATNPACTSEDCEVIDGAMLTIESNDDVKTPLDISVRGLGTNNHCPVAIARARPRGSSAPWDTQLDVIPLVTLELDASLSTDADGPLSGYLWEVTERPLGSTAPLQPRADVANPTFFLDLAGRYIFSLRVYDQTGVESCEPATVLAMVTPNEDIHVQLVWNTNDTDVDLHFMRDGGVWDSQDDCHWKNRAPDWGAPGTDDDPSLDIDDVNSYGPENINLSNPEHGRRYHVGVYYYSDHGNRSPQTDVTIRIFIGGVERFANTFFDLRHHQFWHVADIDWPSADITRINRLYPNGFP
jgi:hypothetical protein